MNTIFDMDHFNIDGRKVGNNFRRILLQTLANHDDLERAKELAKAYEGRWSRCCKISTF